MSTDTRLHLIATRDELAAAQEALAATLTAAPDDEDANEHIAAATARLRMAQARHTAAQSGLAHLPDLIGWG